MSNCDAPCDDVVFGAVRVPRVLDDGSVECACVCLAGSPWGTPSRPASYPGVFACACAPGQEGRYQGNVLVECVTPQPPWARHSEPGDVPWWWGPSWGEFGPFWDSPPHTWVTEPRAPSPARSSASSGRRAGAALAAAGIAAAALLLAR